MDLGLAGKTVIVTGGASNIGRGIVLAFVREGSNVIIADIDQKQAQMVADETSTLGKRATYIKTDVTNWNSMQLMVQKTLECFGVIDVLVNNVGGAIFARPFVDKSREEWQREIDLNFWSVINGVRSVVDHMIERRYGKIINIGSVSGQSGLSGATVAVYGGTKGGIIALSKALAYEFGPYGININVVCPGGVAPARHGDVGEESTWSKWGFDFYTPEKLDMAIQSIPLRQPGNAEDIAHMVVFLASDCTSYVTGQTISVSGGATMW